MSNTLQCECGATVARSEARGWYQVDLGAGGVLDVCPACYAEMPACSSWCGWQGAVLEVGVLGRDRCVPVALASAQAGSARLGMLPAFAAAYLAFLAAHVAWAARFEAWSLVSDLLARVSK